ncbi:MAG: PRC-barrel domain-containing protein, partial [Burkholderiaceae bacterium]
MQSKKLKKSVALMLPIFGLALAAPVYAASKSATTMNKPAQTQRVAMRDMRLSQLIGKDVRNAQGEDLGDIKDVILDVNNGRVHYVVLSFGGFLG